MYRNNNMLGNRNLVIV